MRDIRYVRANPTGNITCLVLSRVREEERPTVTSSLMDRCEQVGYLEVPDDPKDPARLRMMGGEFCGNASMAAGAYLAEKAGMRPGEEAQMMLAVSGTEQPVRCRIRALDTAWEGTVEMPGIPDISTYHLAGKKLICVRMDGITHLISEQGTFRSRDAEDLLRMAAEDLGAAAVGLLQWNEKTGYMTPLVYVPGSETMIWESGCGSGSTAIGVWRAACRGEGKTITEVRQPGGIILVQAEISGGRLRKSSISGRVILDKETRLSI